MNYGLDNNYYWRFSTNIYSVTEKYLNYHLLFLTPSELKFTSNDNSNYMIVNKDYIQHAIWIDKGFYEPYCAYICCCEYFGKLIQDCINLN